MRESGERIRSERRTRGDCSEISKSGFVYKLTPDLTVRVLCFLRIREICSFKGVCSICPDLAQRTFPLMTVGQWTGGIAEYQFVLEKLLRPGKLKNIREFKFEAEALECREEMMWNFLLTAMFRNCPKLQKQHLAIPFCFLVGAMKMHQLDCFTLLGPIDA
eukprot:567024_1